MNTNTVPVINMVEIGKRIKTLRKARQLKVTDISERMGFESPVAVYKWQRGECLPEVTNLIILSRMLGTSVEGIILGDEDVPFPLFWGHGILCVKCHGMSRNVLKLY